MITKITTILTIITLVIFGALSLLLAGSLLPPSVGYQIRIINSGSMVPTLPIGSGVMVRPIDNYVVGDIVTFKRPTDIEATTHRIYSDSIIDGELAYTTQGDANNTPDLLTVMKSDIIGKVWFSVPYLGYLLDFIRRPLGFVLLVGLPALWVFIEHVNKIVTETKRVKKKTDPDITTTI